MGPPTHIEKFIDVMICPACNSELTLEKNGLRCKSASHRFPVTEGIPQMFVPNEWQNGKLDVTDKVRQFYEKTPFPNYDDFDSVAALVEKSRKGRFARALDEHFPTRTRVLEVGCGTGQLTNFLGITQRGWYRYVSEFSPAGRRFSQKESAVACQFLSDEFIQAHFR